MNISLNLGSYRKLGIIKRDEPLWIVNSRYRLVQPEIHIFLYFVKILIRKTIKPINYKEWEYTKLINKLSCLGCRQTYDRLIYDHSDCLVTKRDHDRWLAKMASQYNQKKLFIKPHLMPIYN